MSTYEVVIDKLEGELSSDRQLVHANGLDSEHYKEDHDLNNKSESADINGVATREGSPETDISEKVHPSATIDPTEGDESDTTQQEPMVTPEPAVPHKKKRLTLQERLALAANKGGKKLQKKPKENYADATPRSSTDTQDRSSMELDTTIDPDESDTADDHELLPSNYLELEHSALLEVLKKGLDKFSNLKSSLQKERSVNQDLKIKLNNKETEIKLKDTRLQELSKSVSGSTSTATSKKLEEKENIIKELMEEGSKLSMKELNLSNTIKKLKAKANEDSDLLADLQEKLDETLERLASYELKEVALKEFETKREQLISNLLSLESKLQKSQEDYTRVSQQYKDLKAQRFEQQLESTKSKLDEEVKKNKELTLQLEELNIRLKLLKDQSKNEVAELEEKLEKERKRYHRFQEESASEIKRLEDKMELLRIMSESSSDLKKDDTANDSFKKLAASNELLQSQYTLAQENWKFIESSYLNKIAQAEQDINVLKQKDLTSMKKIKVISSDLKAKNDELEEVLEKEGVLVSEIATTTKKLQEKDDQISELKQLIENLKEEIRSIKVDSERQLKDELAKQKEAIEKEIEEQANKSFDGPTQQQALYLNDLLPNPSFLKSRSVSNFSWNDNIAFGESSTTPRSSHVTSRKTSSSVLNQFPNSFRTPLVENGARFFESPREAESPNIYDHPADESYFEGDFSEDYNTTANSPTSQNSSKFTLHRESNVGSVSGGVNNKHVQIIGKLSSQIRRLEIESLTLKDEIDSLKKEKNESNNEIVKLLKENSETHELKTQKELLEKKVNELDRKYQKTLELLGEKSERVEELKADVADLKELCREQVQQLVGLQPK